MVEKPLTQVTFEDVLYYDRLPSYDTVYRFFREYTRLGEKKFAVFWAFVDKYGIYQFWNEEYVKCFAEAIKARVGSDFVLEVGAGDGMLSHYLRQFGVNIRATDSGEWYDRVTKRAEVEVLDAVSAIRKYKPRMVVASWLPYEKELDIQVFDEKVPIIVLIGEEHGATGSRRFWDKEYWKKAGYEREYSECDRWNICRTDYVTERGLFPHSSTTFYTLKTKQKHWLFKDIKSSRRTKKHSSSVLPSKLKLVKERTTVTFDRLSTGDYLIVYVTEVAMPWAYQPPIKSRETVSPRKARDILKKLRREGYREITEKPLF